MHFDIDEIQAAAACIIDFILMLLCAFVCAVLWDDFPKCSILVFIIAGIEVFRFVFIDIDHLQ